MAVAAAAALRGVMVVVVLDRKHGDPFRDGFGGDMVAHEFLDTCHIDYDWWKYRLTAHTPLIISD